MFSKVATLFTLSLLTTTVWGAPPPKVPAMITRSQPDLMGPEGPVGADISLTSGPGDWIAAAFFSLTQLDFHSNQLKERITFDASTQTANITFQREVDNQSCRFYNETHSVTYDDTKSLLFNSGDYWWPNAVVKAALQMGGYSGVEDNKLSLGDPASVFGWFGLPSVTYGTSDFTEDLLRTWLAYNTSRTAVVIHTKEDGGHFLDPYHSYSLMQAPSSSDMAVALHDPCAENLRMLLDKSKLTALLIATLTARAAPLEGTFSRVERGQPALMGPTGSQGEDVKLQSGDGDWLAAAIYSSSLVTLKNGHMLLSDKVKAGPADNKATIVTTLTYGAVEEKVVRYNDSAVFLFDAGEYWWPNAVVEAIQATRGSDILGDPKLSPGNSQYAFERLGLYSDTVVTPTDEQLETYFSQNTTAIPIVIHTQSDGGVLKASHSYSVLGATKAKKTTGEEYMQVKLRDPCDWLVNHELEDIKGHIDWLSYGCEDGCKIE
nr:uncharacterized protein CI109_000212 [Kwoniella shandongensis]KAA5531371.1 hypothetical protein CI109_000212 [Kwoniella shandongensis]